MTRHTRNAIATAVIAAIRGVPSRARVLHQSPNSRAGTVRITSAGARAGVSADPVLELPLRDGAAGSASFDNPVFVRVAETYGGTPLEWALYQWGNSPRQAERGSHYETAAILTLSGAKLDDDWFQQDDEERRPCSSQAQVRLANAGGASR